MPQNVHDIQDLDFWNIESRFLTNTDVQHASNYWDRTGVTAYSFNEQLSDLAAGNTNSGLRLDDIWIPSDGLAKSFYSTILVDLGQTNVTPNILTDENTLQFFTKNFTTMQGHTANAHPGPARDSFEALKGETGPLEISPAVISSKYLCQIPKRKSPGTLIIAILVANLVLIQASWKLFSLCASGWLTHKRPEGRLRVF